MSKPKTLVTFLLDRTGSMAAIKDDTIGGFNTYLTTLKAEQDAEISFTFVQFDSISIDKLFVRVPVATVPDLTNESFQPRASTPLIDAAYKTIKAVEASLNGEPPKIVICIQTDGLENASVEHTWDELNALIKEKTAAGWQFNFMGAGIDAYEQGRRMGIKSGSTIAYAKHDSAATRASFAASASNAADFSAGRSLNTNYSAKQREASKDAFVPDDLKEKKAEEKVKEKVKPLVDDLTL